MTSPLREILINRIKQKGPISIAEYMALALRNPQGYYTSRDPFGELGDFTTAPEISQMFGEMLGAWAAYVWQQLPKGNPVNLVELGPGRGTMMADILRATKNTGMHQNISVHMVEVSPVLKKLQQQNLDEYDIKKNWHENIATLPQGSLVILANEFFDALPVYQLIRENGKLKEVRIDFKESAFKKNYGHFTFAKYENAALIKNLKDGDILEISPESLAALKFLSGRINNYGGAMLVIDYGYDQLPLTSTLQAVKSHKYHDFLDSPGEADLTAHVDFPALAKAAASTKVSPIIGQGQFLKNMGIELRAQLLRKNADQKTCQDIDAALMRLTGSNGMGNLFKVMAISSSQIEVPGF